MGFAIYIGYIMNQFLSQYITKKAQLELFCEYIEPGYVIPATLDQMEMGFIVSLVALCTF